MARLLSLLTIVMTAAPALAQQAPCTPEVATVTIDVPTGRCAPSAALAQPFPAPPSAPPPALYAPQQMPPVYAPQHVPPVYAPQYYAPQPYTPQYYPQQPSLLSASPQFRYEEREIRGLWIAGLALWAAMWASDWITTGLSEEADLRNVALIPLVGPWIQLSMGQGAGSGGETLLIADGIAQAAGVVMIFVGALVKREVRVRDRSRVRLGVAPTQSGGALSLSGTF